MAVIIVVINRETSLLAFLSLRINSYARARKRPRAEVSLSPLRRRAGSKAQHSLWVSCSSPRRASSPCQANSRPSSSLPSSRSLPAHLGLTLLAEKTHVKQRASYLSPILEWLRRMRESLHRHCSNILPGTRAWVSHAFSYTSFLPGPKCKCRHRAGSSKRSRTLAGTLARRAGPRPGGGYQITAHSGTLGLLGTELSCSNCGGDCPVCPHSQLPLFLSNRTPIL